VRAVTPYYVCGIALAVWAVFISFLGITRENFPGTAGAQRIVGAISVLLALATIAMAIYTAATEDEESDDGAAAVVLPF
jgi:hypothetical protein